MLREIKQEFYAYRNGIVADALRKAGMPYKVIFGLQVPQLAEISRQIIARIESQNNGNDTIAERRRLAQALWDDRGVRESRLLACYLFDHTQMDRAEAESLLNDIQTPEERDMLNFRLLRHYQS